MSQKALKIDNIRVIKKEIHKSKQPINLDLINVYQIVVSEKLSIVIVVSNILLVTRKLRFLNSCVLSYLT